MVCYFSDCFNWAQNQHFIQKHEILTASVGRVDHETRPFRLMAHKKTTQNAALGFASVCCLCVRNKKTIFGVRWCKTEMQKKSSSGPAAATCRLGSWRPTGEVPLHLGRAMMMMHTSWSLASDTALKTPVHIFLSLCYLPALNTWSQKAFFFPTILHLTTTGFFFRFLGQHLSLSLESQPKSTSSSSSLASDLYPMSRNKTLHSSSCTLLSVSYLHLFSHLHGSH